MSALDFIYGWEKLYNAIRWLASSGTQKERLTMAVSVLYNPEIMSDPEKHLPEEIRDEYMEFLSKMTSVDAIGKEGNIAATVNGLNQEQINEAISDIFSFYDNICRSRWSLGNRNNKAQ